MFNIFENPLRVLAKLTGRQSFQDDFNPGYGTGNDALSGGQNTETILEDLGVSSQRIRQWKVDATPVLSFGKAMPFNAVDGNEIVVPKRPGIDELTGMPEAEIGAHVRNFSGGKKSSIGYAPRKPGM